ncbi:putative pre-rrna processing protein utp22 [Erysiphe necator]|uniref:U3 small nucleolar RNA-associated protein 22 n=1 Tax=Uncinula necator TaxID=52586 RepID=A0A0B1NZF5_UNCNE|nr:putative pre-rrna processing protein utp22 [Erysiphe necator]
MSPSASKRRKLDLQNDIKNKHESHSSVGLNDSIRKNQDHSKSPSPERDFKKIHSKQRHDSRENLQFIGGEYGTSLFKLQVDELMREIEPSYEKKFRGVEDILDQLKSLIEKAEPQELQSISDASRLLQKSYGVTVPYPNPKPDKDLAYKVTFAKPTSINVVGSYILKTMTKSKSVLSIDMIVVMPQSIFQSKDYLNYRYFYKRAYYLAYLAAKLESSSKERFEYNFEHLHGNELHPILIARPKIMSTTYQIRIIPAAPETLFPLPKLRPSRNSVRPRKGNDSEIKELTSTPFYNSSLTSDCNIESYFKFLHATSKNATGFKDACILGRIWLRQRGFDGSIRGGGFGHFEWAAMSAILLKGGIPKDFLALSSGYSSFQMFRSFLQFLSKSDLTIKPFVLNKNEIGIQKSNTPIFYDSPREHNILFKMSPWSYKLLRLEAKTTLDMLSDNNIDHFDSIFITKISQPLLRFDYVFSISQGSQKFQNTCADHVPEIKNFSNRLYRVLEKGLKDRVKLIYIKEHPSITWPIKSSASSIVDESVTVSVLFDPVNVNRLVDYGPSAEEDIESAEFRKFWGQKAELRRFKDGSILETLVWPAGSTQSIFETIVLYLVERHWDLKTAKNIKFMGGGMENLLPDLAIDQNQYNALQDAFKSLEVQIRSLEGLPLQVKHLSAVDPQLRYTSILSPSFGPGRPMNRPADVLIEFEGSGKWPDDLTAIQRVKASFLLRIGKLLEETNKNIKPRLGLENENQYLQNCSFLDVIYLDGPVFRLRVHCDKEQTILERQIKNKSTERHLRDEAVLALSAYKRHYVQLPLLTQSISIHCTRSPLLSSSIRLVKLWLNHHMLCRHFSEEIIEMIVARTFLKPHPWQTPSSITTAFLRTIFFLAKWDWRTTPLIVDFNNILTNVQIGSINTQLEAWRKIDPALNRTVLLVASNHDLSGTAFSAYNPSKMIAARMTALARSASNIVKDMEYELDNKLLFTTSLIEYDFVIYLSDKYTSNYQKGKSSKVTLKNLDLQSEKILKKVGYHPIQLYLKELETLYSNTIIFFHEMLTGSLIAGLWDPQFLQPRSFKVNLSYSTCVRENNEEPGAEVVINQASILAEIARLGGDLVSKIVTQKSQKE